MIIGRPQILMLLSVLMIVCLAANDEFTVFNTIEQIHILQCQSFTGYYKLFKKQEIFVMQKWGFIEMLS